MEERLKELTESVLSEIYKFDIVMPSLYLEIFQNRAKELNIEFEDRLNYSIDKELDKLYNIQDRTLSNSNRLYSEVESAKKAIKERDSELLNSIESSLVSMQQEIEKLKNELHRDELTSIYNRKWLIEEYLEDGKFKTSGTLAFLDLNRFKYINDNYGHLAGDRVLKVIADFISKIPNSDAIRYAGDEFLLISNDNVSANLTKALNRVLEGLKKTNFQTNNQKFKVSFSYGVVLFRAKDTLSDVLELADEKMYQNKEKYYQGKPKV